MAQEIRVTSALSIKNGNLFYISQPGAFIANMAGTKGPTPGSVTVTTDGVDVSLAQLTALGGMCRVMNVDLTNKIQIGPKDTGTGKFYPFMDLLPGETYTIRLSDFLGKDEPGTGTFGGTGTFHAKSRNASCVLLVEAFDA